MYREDRVPLERIQTHLKDTRWTATKGSAGGVMQDAILQIEHDILSSRLRHERCVPMNESLSLDGLTFLKHERSH